MVENNNSDKAGQENTDDPQKCCPSSSGDSACCSSAASSYSKKKLVVLVIIVAAAGIILARSLMKESNTETDDSQQSFAALGQENNCQTTPQTNAATDDSQQSLTAIAQDKNTEPSPQINAVTPDKTELTLWGPELDSIVSLNKIATNTDAVFVFLAAEDQQGNQAIIKEIEAAAQKIRSNGSRVGAFRLKKDAPDYAQLAKQTSIPCVLAMVKGRGMSAVSGEIDETKLVQAFVTASRPRSVCCPPGAAQTDCE